MKKHQCNKDIEIHHHHEIYCIVHQDYHLKIKKKINLFKIIEKEKKLFLT